MTKKNSIGIDITSKQYKKGLEHGYRSGLELDIASQLTESGVNARYESVKLSYTRPATKHTYTPDFILPKKDGTDMIIETKGRFLTADRKKMVLVQKEYPDLDIRFIFTNSKNKLYKGAKSTYGEWCTKRGFPYADKHFPSEWLIELL